MGDHERDSWWIHDVPYTHTDAMMTPIKYAPKLGSMINDGSRRKGGRHTLYPRLSLLERTSGTSGEREKEGNDGIIEFMTDSAIQDDIFRQG